MRYKSVPALKGQKLSAIGFGTWSLGASSGWTGSSDVESVATIHKAIDCGINFFDTAPVYGFGGSETVLGGALKQHRNTIFLASKCGLVWDDNKTISNDLSSAAVIADVEASLKRLHTDRLDLLQLHWPDPKVALEETASALVKLLESGKILNVGVTNFSLADTLALNDMVPLVTCQGLYNMLERNPESYHALALDYRTEREILPLCREKGYAFFPYSPLFQGLLTGTFKMSDRFSDNDVRSANPKLKGEHLARYLKIVEELKPIAQQAGISMADLALAWLVANDAVTSIICGAQSPEQIAENAIAGDITLEPHILEAIWAVQVRYGL